MTLAPFANSGRRKRDLARAVWGALFIGALFATPVLASGALKQGIDAYKKNEYKEAIKLLNKAENEDPYNAELHYYLANCYVFLHDGESAIKQYSRCFDLEPLSTFGQYSRQALLGFGKKFKGFSGPDDGKEHLAPDDPKSIKQAVVLIRKQTMDQDQRAHTFGENAAQAAMRKGESRERQINREVDQLTEELAPHAHNPVVQQELHEMRQKAVFTGQHARYEAQQQAAKQMEHAAQNAMSLESSAASLLRLISEDPIPGRIKLKALGTNLYVRNYGMEPKPPLEPLLAEWELIGSSKTKASSTLPATVTSSVQNNRVKEKDSVLNLDHLALQAVPHIKMPPKTNSVKIVSTAYEESSDAEFTPGSSKVLVTDMRGRVLVHIKEKPNKQEK